MPGFMYRDPNPDDERCLCGNLLARLTPAGVEILCRRCKRKHVIRWAVREEEMEEVETAEQHTLVD